MILAGLDYSITGPSICIIDKTSKFCFENCKFFFLTDTKKYQKNFLNNIKGNSVPIKYKHDTERFDRISEYFLQLILQYKIGHVLLEGYSMGSRGKVFNLAENTGILKHKLYINNIRFDVVPPTVIKKASTGKGNADKNKMHESFNKEVSIDLKKELCYTKNKIESPISDLVDSYFLLRYLYNEEGDFNEEIK